MLIRPEIAALRGITAPQRGMHAAKDAWRAAAAAVLAALDDYGAGADLADCAPLAALFTPDDPAADKFVARFTGTTLAALAAQPLGHVAARCRTNGVTSTLLLGAAGPATLVLWAIDGAGLARGKLPPSVSFAPVMMTERVLAGAGEVALYRRGDDAVAGLERRARTLEAGDICRRDGRDTAMLFERVSGRLVMLKLQRGIADGGPVCEYELASGRLIHRASAFAADSRREMMVTLLARMGREDAVPHFARIARDTGSEDHLRWQALRECLGLDSGTGFTALCAIAADAADPLARHAGALRAQLLEAHPQLERLVPCPA